MDIFAELWSAAKQAGPFASLLLLVACWALNERNKAQAVEHKQDKDALRQDYEKRIDKLEAKIQILEEKVDTAFNRFISLAGDTQITLKEWRELFSRATEK